MITRMQQVIWHKDTHMKHKSVCIAMEPALSSNGAFWGTKSMCVFVQNPQSGIFGWSEALHVHNTSLRPRSHTFFSKPRAKPAAASGIRNLPTHLGHTPDGPAP